MIAGFRVSAWLAVLLGSIVTFVLALWVWGMPLGNGFRAYFYGSATGVWNVDWITFWGLMLFNTLGLTGLFENLRRWLISVPVLTPYLSSLWLALVTPASFEIGRHLIEGLKNPTVVRDGTALDVFPIRPMGIREAIHKALAITTA